MIGSHFLRQGIWASITGGWYHEPLHSIFCNVFHLYLWLFLLCAPFIVFLASFSNIVVWAVYVVVIFFVYLGLKLFSLRMHHMYDTTEGVQVDVSTPLALSREIEVSHHRSQPSTMMHGVSGDEAEGIELAEINKSTSNMTPPVLCSSRATLEDLPVVRCDKDTDKIDHQADVHYNDLNLGYMDGTDDFLPSECNVHNCTVQSNKCAEEEDNFSEEVVNVALCNGKDVGKKILEGDDLLIPAEDSTACEKFNNEEGEDCSNVCERNLIGQGDILSEEYQTLTLGLNKVKPPLNSTKIFKVRDENDSQPWNTVTSSGDMMLSQEEVYFVQTPDSLPGVSAQRMQNMQLDNIQLVAPQTDVHSLRNTNSFKADATTPDSVSQLSLTAKRPLGENNDCSLCKTQVMDPNDIGKFSQAFSHGDCKHAGQDSLGVQRLGTMGSSIESRTSNQSAPSSPSTGTFFTPQSSRKSSVSESRHVSPKSLLSDLEEKSESNQTLGEDTKKPVEACGSGTEMPENIDMVMLRQSGAIPKRRNTSFLPSDDSEDDVLPVVQMNEQTITELGACLAEILKDDDPGRNFKNLKRLLVLRQYSEQGISNSEDQLKTSGNIKGNIPVRTKSESRGSEHVWKRRRAQRRRNRVQRSSSPVRPLQPANDPPSSHGSTSSSSFQTEASALVPVNGQGDSYGLRKRHDSQLSKRSSTRSDKLSTTGVENQHVAETYEDTSEGALHVFQDEDGNWFSYKFGENSTGMAVGMINPPEYLKYTNGSDHCSSDVIEDGSDGNIQPGIRSTSLLPFTTQPPLLPPPPPLPPTRLFPNPLLSLPTGVGRSPIQSYMEALLESGSLQQPRLPSVSNLSTPAASSISVSKPHYQYKLECLPRLFINVPFDRLQLLTLLDRNSALESIISIFLGVCVSIFAGIFLHHQFYQEFWSFLFCLVVASCQYSLLKSVQPDACSPVHGFNRLIIFSRSFYFCICSTLVLLLHYGAVNGHDISVTVYSIQHSTHAGLMLARDSMLVLILCFPVLFSWGLFPQVNTFLMYLFEQVEIHLFGGSATSSLFAAFFAWLRSCISICLLYGFCFVALKKKESSQHVLFSVYCGLMFAFCYHLSRSPSDPSIFWQLLKKKFQSLRKLQPNSDLKGKSSKEEEMDKDNNDPLPGKLRRTVYDRLRSDLIVCCISCIFVFAIHVSTVFSSPPLKPILFDVLTFLVTLFGFVIHYLLPHLRKERPWLFLSKPLLPSAQRNQFEVSEPAVIMWFEKLSLWLSVIERNILLPAITLCATTLSATEIASSSKFGVYFGSLIVVVCSCKMLRAGFSSASHQFYIIIFTYLFFKFDFTLASETFLLDYFFCSIVFSKVYELLLKLDFIFTYIAPWHMTWGSAFHAFAQPLSLPHSAMLIMQAIVSSLLSTPLNPLLGSAIFITSYLRPVKFWEKDYNTKRVDHTNTQLSSQFERNPGADDNNLNSIFYEHLTRSLQHSLCGDLFMGRWGNFTQGDMFIITSDYLNALVHIIEVGNGYLTFQLRGLEFRGTYCQQREVEAITEGVDDDRSCCCFELGHLPHCLSVNAAFNQHWLAWEVIVTKYVLEGYSIWDNSAFSMLQVFDLRKVLVTYYMKTIIYYTVRSPKLEEWLSNVNILAGLELLNNAEFADLDPVFSSNIDQDYDVSVQGVSRQCFCDCYLSWVQHCNSRRDKSVDAAHDSILISFCLGLSLLGRRALGVASFHKVSSVAVNFFLAGLHALFKGDFRITHVRDEWVFSDMEILRRVVAPAVRMSLKLHQDHFTSPDDYDDHACLYDAISSHEQNMVISHEADPAWRNAVLANVPSLLALRHIYEQGSDEYKVVVLNKRFLSFRVIKVNRECVRGLWSGQQQELIYLRNRNAERGSIQNAKQALRNMINSSCDQPIGYPIYVSPLTTSYAGTNSQYTSVVGKEFSLAGVLGAVQRLCRRVLMHCGATCSSGSGSAEEAMYTCNYGVTGTTTTRRPQDASHHTLHLRTSMMSSTSSVTKPMPLGGISSLFSESHQSKELISCPVQIIDPSAVLDTVAHGRNTDLHWPNEDWRGHGGVSGWNGWRPEVNMEGMVVHRWIPCHPIQARRSHLNKTILLVQIGSHFVPILESGVLVLGAEV